MYQEEIQVGAPLPPLPRPSPPAPAWGWAALLRSGGYRPVPTLSVESGGAVRGSGPSVGPLPVVSGTQRWAGLGLGREPLALPQHQQLSHTALPLEHSPEPSPISYCEPELQVRRVQQGTSWARGGAGPGELARAGLVREGSLFSGPSGSPGALDPLGVWAV